MPRLNPKKSPEKPETPSPDPASEVAVTRPFEWNEQRSKVAVYLSQGYTWKETAKEHQIAESTIANWKRHPDFAAEVDRLSLMVDVAGRAYRLRLAMRVIREKGFESERDLLDWLKYAQSETDGVKLDLAKLSAAFNDPNPPMAGGRPGGEGENRSTGADQQ